jgi:hypothetical protein
MDLCVPYTEIGEDQPMHAFHKQDDVLERVTISWPPIRLSAQHQLQETTMQTILVNEYANEVKKTLEINKTL